MRRAGLPLLLLGVLLPDDAQGQQFVVDDAALVDHRACQLEGWWGEAASWILPACQPVRNIELTAGVGFNHGNGTDVEYVVQVKTLFRGMEGARPGIGLVIGAGVDPLAQATGRRFSGAYAYIPASWSPLEDDRLVLHGNLGWHVELDDDDHGHDHEERERHDALTWGLRGDLVLNGRFILIGELFGEDRIQPEYQVGIQTFLLPDLLHADVSFGGHTASGFSGAGWSAGLAWTPHPFL